jgi:uncharacterized repeat protein (TIGR01451 family)
MGTAAPSRRRPGGRFRTDVLALLVLATLCALAATVAHAAGKRGNPNPKEKCPNGLQLIQPVETGTYEIAFGAENGSISLVVRTTSQGPLVDFTTDGPSHLVDRVVVKRGDGGNTFDYRPDGTTTGTVHAPKNPQTGKYHVPSYLCVETRLKPPPPPTDVCPNIPGVQPEIPPGLIKDEKGDCVPPPPPDVCPNIPGLQTEIPPGMIKDANGNCVTPPPPPTDVCPNIPGLQTEIPPGMIKDANGNCVTPPPPAPPNVDLSIVKVDSPDPVSVGRTIDFELTVRNSGPGKASGIEVTDTLPAGVEFVSVRSNQGRCTGAGRTVTCDLLGLT